MPRVIADPRPVRVRRGAPTTSPRRTLTLGVALVAVSVVVPALLPVVLDAMSWFVWAVSMAAGIAGACLLAGVAHEKGWGL